MLDQGSRGWDQRSEGWNLGSQLRDQGSQAKGSGSAVFLRDQGSCSSTIFVGSGTKIYHAFGIKDHQFGYKNGIGDEKTYLVTFLLCDCGLILSIFVFLCCFVCGNV